MKFLFEYGLGPEGAAPIYRIYETVENSFFAESTATDGPAGFHFHRIKSEWISDDPAKQPEAEQLGKEVDKIS